MTALNASRSKCQMSYFLATQALRVMNPLGTFTEDCQNAMSVIFLTKHTSLDMVEVEGLKRIKQYIYQIW